MEGVNPGTPVKVAIGPAQNLLEARGLAPAVGTLPCMCTPSASADKAREAVARSTSCVIIDAAGSIAPTNGE